MPLSANLFRLESSFLTRTKLAINRNNEASNSLNAVERESVPTRVLNPNASEASYKLKQRSYRKTKLKKTGGEKPAWKRPSGEKNGGE